MVTLGEKQLAQTVEYLRDENRILRSKPPKRIPVKLRERSRLLRYGKRLGTAINGIITIVSPRTFARWVSGDKRSSKPGRTSGWPRTKDDIRKIVLRLARETGWGYTRILGELKKLGIHTVCQSTVINILREAGLDPGPKRGVGTWSEFLERHADTLWASDFLSVKNLDTQGIGRSVRLFFIHPGRERCLSPASVRTRMQPGCDSKLETRRCRWRIWGCQRCTC